MARERYLVGAGEDTIHSGVIELKTPKDKRANWWYYHKRQLLFGLIAAGLLGSLIYSIASKVEPDYSVALVTSYNLPEEVRSGLEEHIALYADDRNGDGKVTVQVNSYVFGEVVSAQDYQATQATYARFAGDTTLGSNMIYIHDAQAFENLGDSFDGFFQYNDGTPMKEGASDYEEAMRPWSDYKGLAEFTVPEGQESKWTPEVVAELCGRLRVSLRTDVGSNIENNKKLEAYYQDSLVLAERLRTGEKP